MTKFGKVEQWAIDMKKHIDWLESKEKPTVLDKIARGLKR